MADEERTAEVEKVPAMGHQRQVMFVRLSKADARVKANSFSRNACCQQCIASLGKVRMNFPHNVVVPRVVLHRLRRPPHVHRTDSHFFRHGKRNHPRVARETSDVIDNFGPGSIAAAATSALEVSMEIGTAVRVPPPAR